MNITHAVSTEPAINLSEYAQSVMKQNSLWLEVWEGAG